MELVGELQRGADEWLRTLEKGCMQLQVMVGEPSSRSNEEPEVEGGAISLADWLKDMTDDMLNIIWTLEEGPDPQLEACIDWRKADGMMSTCYALFTEGRNLCYMLEERLEGDNDMEDEVCLEDGANEDDDNTGVSINNNNNNDNNNNNSNNNNNNNVNNNGHSDNDSVNNSNYNDDIKNNVVINSFNEGGEVVVDDKCINKDNNNDNNNNNKDINSGTGSSDNALVFTISMVSEMPGSDVDSGKGIGAETKWGFILPLFNLDMESLIAVRFRAAVG
ncbi:hypothetical protein CBR_g31722 [Chara braunii]|uniref:Uncharacterized protein n=1 Tax=Chara braunii TaxID=69332 RepID=A0A388JY61_CHABU|nr:hypothetical protein CBR_g31722 [Chara braunii]|eukprot:GBG62705.1 hypothetical protein CBR_g31722 [Chara braunii]